MEDERELEERCALAFGRIAEIPAEETVPAPYNAFFRKTAAFILTMKEVRDDLLSGRTEEFTLQQWQDQNRRMYEDVLPAHYETSYANPAYAVRQMGREAGQMLSFLYTEVRGLIGYVFEEKTEIIAAHLELFLEVYGSFEQLSEEEGALGTDDDGNQVLSQGFLKEIRQILYWFVSDYSDVFVTERIRQNVDPDEDFAVRIICESDLNDLCYLYKYGEYISDDEYKLAQFMNTLPDVEIDRMADTYTEGYRLGFIHGKKPLWKKKTAAIIFHVGMERMVRRAISTFREMGLEPVIYRCALSTVNRKGTRRSGFEGADPNPQYTYDHREDAALYLDRRFSQRRLEVMQTAYEDMKEMAAQHAGPAVIEAFGQKPFEPVSKPEDLQLDEKQQKIQAEMNSSASRMAMQYIIGSERSFTIIDFPLPSIGEKFPEIFRAILDVNTLDNQTYEKIQQCLIDALDKGTHVRVLGRGKNRTAMTVQLHPLTDPAKQTRFENCVADVNIPVGEVFTSPQLSGTEGTLHVTRVYLEGLNFENLELHFKDGKITDYTCTNFDSEEDNRAYVAANVLFHHETLPVGEFAIGTNTTAYAVSRKYGIGARLPILIAEKTGPHFAVGDTCYSFEEDNPVFNPDGKEIIARDNSVSLLRKTEPEKAYFGCHTDITIPYDELGLIEVLGDDGYRAKIIENGKFVLPGTEELNKPLEEMR